MSTAKWPRTGRRVSYPIRTVSRDEAAKTAASVCRSSRSWTRPILMSRVSCAAGGAGRAARDQLPHALDALLLEARVADAEHFVNEQHVGIEMRGDREPEPRVHAR